MQLGCWLWLRVGLDIIDDHRFVGTDVVFTSLLWTTFVWHLIRNFSQLIISDAGWLRDHRSGYTFLLHTTACQQFNFLHCISFWFCWMGLNNSNYCLEGNSFRAFLIYVPFFLVLLLISFQLGYSFLQLKQLLFIIPKVPF